MHDALTKTSVPLKNGQVTAYLDDVNLVGPPEEVASAFAVFKHEASKLGLLLNISKTKVLPFPNLSKMRS